MKFKPNQKIITKGNFYQERIKDVKGTFIEYIIPTEHGLDCIIRHGGINIKINSDTLSSLN